MSWSGEDLGQTAKLLVQREGWSVQGMERWPVYKTMAYNVVGKVWVSKQVGLLGHWETCAFYSKPLDCLKHKRGMIYLTL